MMKRVLCLILTGVLLALPLSALQPSWAQASQKVFRKVTPEDNRRAVQLLEQANSLRSSKKYEEAIPLYTKAIHINERLGGYAGRAYCRFQLGDFEQAEREANTSIHNRSARDLLLPGMMGMAEYVRGICRYRQGNFLAAEKDLRIAATSRYATDEVRQMYQDCKAKNAAAKAAAQNANK
jgi:tetratricopeptide (TPR) repeat protein